MAKKIPVSDSASPLATNPFAGLDLGADLPAGPAEAPEVAGPSGKGRPGRVVLRREKSQRGGKTVVVVSDFDVRISAAEIAELARRARQACGCGGTVAAREIEFQGDDPTRVRRFFEAEGFRVAGV